MKFITKIELIQGEIKSRNYKDFFSTHRWGCHSLLDSRGRDPFPPEGEQELGEESKISFLIPISRIVFTRMSIRKF